MNANMIAIRQQVKTQHIPTPLDVASWEVRRCWASPSSRRLVLIAFGLFLLVIWLVRHPANAAFSGGGSSVTFQVSGTSAWGIVILLSPFSFLLALLLPILNSGGVAHDVKGRTHELLMTTPVPAWAFVIGRYLFYLLASLGLALLMLAAVLLMGLVLHLTEQGYLAPQVNAILSLWVVAILPTTILLSSLSFALGTLLLRHSNLAALVVIVGWFLSTIVLPLIPVPGLQLPLWYKTWEPTNVGMSAVLIVPYQSGIDRILTAMPSDQPTLADSQHTLYALQVLEQKAPDVLPWLVPHLVWVGIGLALVLFAALSFKRFRNVLN
jgi:ABC-type transport system involved in multi-copper enzyme maturation permease subunit